MTDPLPSLHKLLTAAEENSPLFLSNEEVAELRDALIIGQMQYAALQYAHDAMAAQLTPRDMKH